MISPVTHFHLTKMKVLLLLGLPLVSTPGYAQRLMIRNLACEYKTDPVGIGIPDPHLKWELQSSQPNVVQTAYRVIVSDDISLLEKGIGNVWDTRKVSSDSSIQIRYQGKKLASATTYHWKVMVWDNHHDSAWSSSGRWQMGLLDHRDWKGASWIAYEKMPDADRILPGDRYDKKEKRNDVLPLFRKEFSVEKKIKKATVFISGLGQFEMYLNGKKVGDHFLDPAWTQYEKEASYVSFDITDALKKGLNAIGVMLGNGFYYIPEMPQRYRKLMVEYGYPKMICLVKVDYTDGTSEDIPSGPDWKVHRGPIIFSSTYGGEDYDARLEQPGWALPGFNDRDWRSPVVVDGPPGLQAQLEDPVKVFDHFSPDTMYQVKPGVWIYDLGQNASGIPEITVQGGVGDTIRITPAEVLDKDGMISQRGSGGPSYFTYILKGKEPESWHPRFSYYGFRYLEVQGAVPPGKKKGSTLPVLVKIEGLHTRNAATRTGSFTCSSELFNRIYKLIDWSIQSNMVSLFTDCPHREKLGWLEETHLMGNSVHYNYDIANLCRRTILNMEAAQTPEGLVPEIAPEYVQFSAPFRDSPEWGSASVIVPWYVYQWYGDKRVLQQSYSMMQRYVDYLGTRAKDHILSYGLSDWFDLGPGALGIAQLTPMGVTATAIYYYDLTILQKTAALLGRPEDATRYQQLASQVRKAFNRCFFFQTSREYATGSQTANAMAVYMGLVEPAYKNDVIQNIVKDIRSRDNSLTSGDIGYRYLLKVLDDAGRSDVIYAMNNRTDVPGYGYQLAHGATALTESWQAYASVSNDHFMLGHLMEWLYDGLGGIRQADSSVAYHQIVISPEPVGDINSCEVHFSCPYGTIQSSWTKQDTRFNLAVVIPANTTARIGLPASPDQTIRESGQPVKGRSGFKILGYNDGKAWVEVGSGPYHFSVN